MLLLPATLSFFFLADRGAAGALLCLPEFSSFEVGWGTFTLSSNYYELSEPRLPRSRAPLSVPNLLNAGFLSVF